MSTVEPTDRPVPRLEQREMTARPQDETQHDGAGGGEGEDDVLELAPSCAPTS